MPTLQTLQKIKTFEEILPILDELRQKNLRIVQCHGVFDLLHPGHIRHFQEAKKLGDVLVITITADEFVNKGPGRPVFNEALRLETLAAIDCIDFVVLNRSEDATGCIRKIKPDVYVKGQEYKDHDKDVTGKIAYETKVVQECQGSVHYTNDIVFSSSSLLNRFFDPLPIGLQKMIQEIKKEYSSGQCIANIEQLADVKVLVIGDAIIDEYQYVEMLGQSGKGLHMSTCNLDRDLFVGGSLIIANHLAEFSKHVTLVSAIGNKCPFSGFIQQTLSPKVQTHFIQSKMAQTLTKKRYVSKDGRNLTKLFETYSSNQPLLDAGQTKQTIDIVQTIAKDYDLVLVCDFGNGLMNQPLIQAISGLPNPIALNTQSNSGNRGFHVVTLYDRADYVSLNEPEARLAVHDRHSSIDVLAENLIDKMNCKAFSMTRGVKGVSCYNQSLESFTIPALNTNTVDRVGAGDSYFALSSLCLVKQYSLRFSALIGSIAAALDVEIIGNKEPVKKSALLKFLIRILK